MGLKKNFQDGKDLYPKTLILGIGNILRRDDGVGIHVINRLRRLDLSPEIMLLDGGTAGADLLHYLQGINRLVVIDAILTDEKPGTIHLFSYETERLYLPIRPFAFSLTLHQTGIIETIEMANLLWGKIDTTIIGIVPEDYLGYGMELTQEVSNAVNEVIDILKKEIFSFHCLNVNQTKEV